MKNVRLDESQAKIKIFRRNINNFRYADDTTLIAESKEELKSLLMKEESGKAGLQLNILAFSHHFMANRWGKSGNSDRFTFLAPKSLWTAAAAVKLKVACSLEEKL